MTLLVGVALLAGAASIWVSLLAGRSVLRAPGLASGWLGAVAGYAAVALALHYVMLLIDRSGGVSALVATATLVWAALLLRRAPRGADRAKGSVAFPNYTQIASRIPLRAWQGMRVLSLAGGLAVVCLLVLRPAVGLFVMWRVVIRSLPALFMIAPGLWRNLCPLAAANQTPRALRLTRGASAPDWLKEYGYVIAFSLFVTFVALRRLGLDRNGPLSALLLFGAMTSAFAGGVALKGKSGWCSSVCPLLPVQRIYGQTPLVTIANAHCQPCVGCVKNCYDFNPRGAFLADLHEPDEYWSGYRRFFVGAFPGLVLSFFVVPHGSAFAILGSMALYLAVSIALFTVLGTFVKASPHTLTALFGAIAFSIFYWFSAAVGPTELQWLLRLAALTLAAAWFLRTVSKEPAWLQRSPTAPVAEATRGPAVADPVVTFLPDDHQVVAAPGQSLLDLAEAGGLSLEAGCRMGICGADPVAVTEGMGCTSPVGDDERATLARLGLGENTRMACCVRPSGPVTVSLVPEPASGSGPDLGGGSFPYDPEIARVVIVGNGVAGVTAADQLRRRHPDVAIDLIAAEPLHLYNRMGIARLVYGRSALEGLALNPDAWYGERAVSTWLNTRAIAIDRDRGQVRLGTGDVLGYDRLILATGARAHIPAISGFGIAGTAVLRTAADAVAIRAYAQHDHARTAVIAGGGLLGLEAAHALRALGLRTIVLERSDRLLRRQLDGRAAELLSAHLAGLGIEVVRQAEVLAVDGGERLRTVRLRSGECLDAQVLLVAAGIAPNVALARACGIDVERGVVVDAWMRTSDPEVYAIGDVAQYAGQTPGLWATAVAQAEVAGENAAGGARTFTPVVPATTLKVAGVDLTSIGRVEAEPGDETIVHEDPDGRRYRKLVIRDGRILGAILLGRGQAEGAEVRAAVARGAHLGSELDALRDGGRIGSTA